MSDPPPGRRRSRSSPTRDGPASIRRGNLSLVLRHVRDQPMTSRPAIVAGTGLNRATVASLVHDLLEWELVAEREGTPTGQSGRPSRPIDLAGAGLHGIGVEIGDRAVTGLLADLSGATGDRRVESLPTVSIDGVEPHDQATAVLEALRLVVTDLVGRSASDGGRLVGVCCGLTGPFGRRAGRSPRPRPSAPDPAVVADAVAGWLDHPSEVVVERAAALAAQAEWRSRSLGSSATVVSLRGGRLVEAGIVVDGRVAHGASGSFGDVGHLVVAPDGPRCWCGGRGCWDTLIGGQGILREGAPDLAGDPREAAPPEALGALADRAGSGDPLALAGLDQVGRWLGVGLASVIAVVDPDVIVLDGFYRRLGPWIVPSALDSLDRHALRSPDPPQLLVTELDAPAALGAAMRAVDRVFDDPFGAVAGATSPGR